MNRHQRRAAAKSSQDAKVSADSSSRLHSGDNVESDPSGQTGIKSESEVTLVDLSDLDIGFGPAGASPDSGARQPSETASGKPKPASPQRRSGILMRWFSRILLSRWVLARVSNPEVERLLMMVALETNRKDAADELTRREAMRGLNTKARR
jgi:hypothetical protein